MSFLRKASMKLKPNEDGTTSPSSRSVSSGNLSLRDPKEEEETGNRPRKKSLAYVRFVGVG